MRCVNLCSSIFRVTWSAAEPTCSVSAKMTMRFFSSRTRSGSSQYDCGQQTSSNINIQFADKFFFHLVENVDDVSEALLLSTSGVKIQLCISKSESFEAWDSYLFFAELKRRTKHSYSVNNLNEAWETERKWLGSWREGGDLAKGQSTPTKSLHFLGCRVIYDPESNTVSP